jgi:tetratricopeptide (TPR) repeat protein
LTVLQRASQLAQRGEWAQAEALCREVLASGADTAAVLALLGAIQHASGRHQEAITSLQQALQLNPGNALALGNLGAAQQELGQTDAAIHSLQQALKLRPDFAIALTNLGFCLQSRGDHEAAIPCFARSLRLRPGNLRVLQGLGWSQLQAGHPDAAIDTLQQVLAQAPEATDIRLMLASAQREARQLQAADQNFRRCATEPHASAAIVAASLEHFTVTRQADTLEQLLNSRGQGLGDPVAQVYAAALALQRQQFSDARALSERLNSDAITALPPTARIRHWSTRAWLDDHTGHIDAAMEAFLAAQQDPAYDPLDPDAQPRRIAAYRQLAEQLAQRRLPPGQAPSAVDPGRASQRRPPVFLMGFPRSGTTLLDTILRSHPAIDVAEEKPGIAALEIHLQETRGWSIDQFARLDDHDVQGLQQLYWQCMAPFWDSSHPVLIDKLPLHICAVPLIQAVFPDATFLLAIRNPRDTVLSCVQQTFAANDAMLHLRSLPEAARFYDQVMAAWLHMQRQLDPAVQVIRYEDLIADLPATIQPVLDRLNLPWDERLLAFQRTARDRDLINTPSAAQVVQPLYSSAINKWRRYRHHLEPCDRFLAAWLDHWGYGFE